MTVEKTNRMLSHLTAIQKSVDGEYENIDALIKSATTDVGDGEAGFDYEIDAAGEPLTPLYYVYCDQNWQGHPISEWIDDSEGVLNCYVTGHDRQMDVVFGYNTKVRNLLEQDMNKFLRSQRGLIATLNNEAKQLKRLTHEA